MCEIFIINVLPAAPYMVSSTCHWRGREWTFDYIPMVSPSSGRPGGWSASPPATGDSPQNGWKGIGCGSNWFGILVFEPERRYVYTVYIIGFDMGAMMPCFMSTRGLTLAWKVTLVCHSGPTGILRECSYSCLDWKG